MELMLWEELLLLSFTAVVRNPPANAVIFGLTAGAAG